MTKKINNDLRNTTQKTKDRAARIPLKTGGDPMLDTSSNYSRQKANISFDNNTCMRNGNHNW